MPTGDTTTTTDEVIDRFNRAFQERDATLLEDIIAPLRHGEHPASPRRHPIRGL
jgi:hypothetical protein